LPVLVSYYGDDGPAERPRSPRGAAFRQEGGGFDKSEFLRLPWSTFSNS